MKWTLLVVVTIAATFGYLMVCDRLGFGQAGRWVLILGMLATSVTLIVLMVRADLRADDEQYGGEPEPLDGAFKRAVAMLDAGDVTGLAGLIEADPRLVRLRLESPGAWLRDTVGGALDGFFARPYLLWFVAEDPVRNGRLPANAPEVARTIIDAARRHAPETLPEQLNYALSLVCWSWIAHGCGVQIGLIDVLADAGAVLDGHPENALVNGHREAAIRVVERGATVSLATALCLGRDADIRRLGAIATPAEKQFALVLAALRGYPAAVREALRFGAAPNDASPDLQSHGRPLHHAVYSGSLESVRALVEAGADLTIRDALHGGTPLGWAEHMHGEERDAGRQAAFLEIAAYLRDRGGRA